ncbi:MAG TPA: hypothetical protein VGQ65_21120 [Thermoanaerobaculia bacterium]|nr:hypothetical protein [Thermoanaerobaculia bacterium]
MLKRITAVVFAISMLTAAVSSAEMTCTAGHIFIYNGQTYCNPGEGPQGCLRCSETIVVGGGGDRIENPEP